MLVDPYANLRQYLNPAVGPEAMKSYRIVSPRDTNTVTPCQRVGCRRYRQGWDTIVDETTAEGFRAAHYIRHESGRTFREGRRGDGMTVFRFEPHQRCFDDHRTRPQLFVVTDGDFRGNPRGTAPRRHARPVDWVEDFQIHQDAIKTRRERG